MKIFSFLLLAVFAGRSAAAPADLYSVDPQEQTSKDLYCRKQFKNWASCAIAQDYVGAGAWKAFGSRACTDTYEMMTDACKGSHYVYVSDRTFVIARVSSHHNQRSLILVPLTGPTATGTAPPPGRPTSPRAGSRPRARSRRTWLLLVALTRCAWWEQHVGLFMCRGA